METRDYGITDSTQIIPANPVTRSPHTHHIGVTNAIVSYDMSVLPANSPATTFAGVVVTGTATTTGNGGPATFEAKGPSTVEDCITAGSGVQFSKITLVYTGLGNGVFRRKSDPRRGDKSVNEMSGRRSLRHVGQDAGVGNRITWRTPGVGRRADAAPLKHRTGRRESLAHTRAWPTPEPGESACPTFVSWPFAGGTPIRDKVEVRNRQATTANMVMVDLGVPTGIRIAQRIPRFGRLEKFSLTPTQAILYFDSIAANEGIVGSKEEVRGARLGSRDEDHNRPSTDFTVDKAGDDFLISDFPESPIIE